MKIQFLGAARTVTGSMHLISVNGSNILLDCGLYQGKRADSFEKNRNVPVDVTKLDAVVLSHAHIDHAGNLPNLIKKGYKGPIYTTAATRNLCNVMLYDSAYIQQRDAEYMTKQNAKKGLPPVEPIYTTEDVFGTIGNFISIGYHQTIPIANGVKMRFADAGHLLGSALTILEIKEGNTTRRLGFSGDLGRFNMPILKDPEPMEDVDILLCESTYGGRIHEPIESMKESLRQIIQKTVDRGGKLIIPSFAVGKTQELLYVLFQLFDEGLLPEVPIYVDSPLSINTTEVFRLHPECFDKEMLKYLYDREDPFGFGRLTYLRSVDESKKLNDRREPCIIISASGMCEAGRILHHLANNIENPKNTILFIGYQAEHTLGFRIVRKEPEVAILGNVHKVNAEIIKLNSFSGHAGQDDLVKFVKAINRGTLKHIHLIHGEITQIEQFAQILKKDNYNNITIPVPGEIVEH